MTNLHFQAAAGQFNARVRRRAVLDGWVDQACIGLLALILVGYPAVAMAGPYVDIADNTMTIIFRGSVFALSIVLLGYALVSRRYRLDPWLAAFLIFYMARLVHDYFFTDIYGTGFIVAFYVLTVLTPTLALGASRLGPDSDRTLARWLMVIGGPMVLAVLVGQRLGLGYNPWAATGGTTSRLMFETLNPISLGYGALTVMLAGMVQLTGGMKKTLFWTVVSIGCVLGGAAVLIAAGSRGPMIAAVAAVVWYVMSKSARRVYVAPLAVVLVVGAMSQTFVFQHLIETLAGGWAHDQSSLDRLHMQLWAIEDFLKSPLIGLHYASNPAEGGYHPHNIFIETAMALGVVGIFLMIMIGVRTVRAVTRSFNAVHPLLTALLIMHTVNAMLSAALWGADAFFALLMLVLIHRERKPARLVQSKPYWLRSPVTRR